MSVNEKKTAKKEKRQRNQNGTKIDEASCFCENSYNQVPMISWRLLYWSEAHLNGLQKDNVAANTTFRLAHTESRENGGLCGLVDACPIHIDRI